MYIRLFIFVLSSLIFGSVFAQQIGTAVFLSDTSDSDMFSSNGVGLYLYNLQTQIGENHLSGSMPSFQEESFVLLSEIDSLNAYPLLQNMRGSQNKSQLYDKYLASLETLLYKVTAFQSQIASEISLLSQEQSRCESQKNTAQKLYDASMLDYNSSVTLGQLLQDVQRASACVAEKTVLLSAKQDLYDMITEKASLTSDKYDYLTEKRSLILDHFDLLHADYLQDITDIQDDLQNY